MGKKKSRDGEPPREPKPPEGWTEAAQPATPPTGAPAKSRRQQSDPEDDKLFRKAVTKAAEKLKEKLRGLDLAKIALRNAKAEAEEARCALEKLADESLPLFSQRKKPAQAPMLPAVSQAPPPTGPAPGEFPPPANPEPKRKRGRPPKAQLEPAAAAAD